MPAQVARWLSRLGWVSALAFALVALGLAWNNRALVEPWEAAVGLSGALAYAGLGALIVARQRGNRIGWLFLAVSVVLALQMLSAQYAIYALRVAPRYTALAFGAAWLQHWVSVPLFLLFSLFVVLYPDGRLPARFWILPLACGAFFWGQLMISDMFAAQSLDYYPLWGENSIVLLASNPMARPVLLLPELADHAWAGAFLMFILAMAAPLFRYRRANVRVRRQLRWLMFLGVVLIVGLLVALIADELAVRMPPVLDPLVVIILGFPLAISIAILRHNLYEMDVVINRTLVYGALTVSLALIYFASVLLLQLLLPQRTTLATALSTLAVAALFSPLRRRLQHEIDRRFYRHKYDAARALTAFAQHARDEVDLERLTAVMLDTIQETVQPIHISLWLQRQSPASNPQSPINRPPISNP